MAKKGNKHKIKRDAGKSRHRPREDRDKRYYDMMDQLPKR